MADDASGGSFEFIGRNIRDLRKAKKWTQEELGQKLRRRKLSRQAISWIESGKNTDLETIADIAGTLGVRLSTLTRDAAEQQGSRFPAVLLEDRTELVEQLLAKPIASWSEATRDSRYRSIAVVRELMHKANEEYEKNPVRCRAIRRLIVSLANYSGVENELTVEVLKDLANITSRVGDHEEALRLLDRAHAVASTCTDAPYQMAIIDFARSIVLSDMQRWADARSLLLKAREVFETADRRRYLRTFHMEAILEGYAGNPENAERIFASVIDEMVSWGDEEEIARVFISLSFVLERAGKLAKAIEYFEKAAAIHKKKHLDAEIARDIWRKAVIDAKLGHFDQAFAEFDEARAKLLELHLDEDVIFLDLHCLRQKVAAGADRNEIRELSSRVAARASSANLPVAAFEAIDWLRRISERLTPDAINHVESFVRESGLNPDLRFEPPDA